MAKKRTKKHQASKGKKAKLGPNPVQATCETHGRIFWSRRGRTPKCPECSGASTTKWPWVSRWANKPKEVKKDEQTNQ